MKTSRFKEFNLRRGVSLFFLPVFTVGQGLGPPTNSALFNNRCLFYLQPGGCEPVVAMACGRLFIDAVHTHARSHTPFRPRNRAPSSPSCPIKRRNLRKWNETSKSQPLLWLTWYDLYYNLDPVLRLSLPLPPTNAFPIHFSLLSLLRLALVK